MSEEEKHNPIWKAIADEVWVIPMIILIIVLVVFGGKGCTIDSRPYIVKTQIGERECYTVNVAPAESEKEDHRLLCPVQTPQVPAEGG